MRRLIAVLTLAFCVIWITLALDSAGADGGTYGGGREEADRPTTVSATEGSGDMAVRAGVSYQREILPGRIEDGQGNHAIVHHQPDGKVVYEWFDTATGAARETWVVNAVGTEDPD